MHLRCIFNDPAGIIIHILISLCRHSPHFHLHVSRLTDHISGTACHKFSHIHSGITMTVSWDRMEIQDCRGCSQHGIITCLRCCSRMGSLSMKFHIHLRGCQAVAITNSDHALLLILLATHMRTQHYIHIVKMPLLYNGFCTADTFLSRLENEFYSSTKLIFHTTKYLCRSKPHCNMSVMSAGMHITWTY